MSSQQIEQLQTKFDKMSLSQKKQFIDKLKIKLNENRDKAWLKFLNDCIMDYEYEIKNDDSIKFDKKNVTDKEATSVLTKPLAALANALNSATKGSPSENSNIIDNSRTQKELGTGNSWLMPFVFFQLLNCLVLLY